MRETPERLRVHRQMDRIARRLRYPVEDLDDLVAQIRDEEFRFYDARIPLSKVVANKRMMAFIRARDFPMRDRDELETKLLRSYGRFARAELRELNGARIKMTGDRDMKPVEAVALEVLAKHGFRTGRRRREHA